MFDNTWTPGELTDQANVPGAQSRLVTMPVPAGVVIAVTLIYYDNKDTAQQLIRFAWQPSPFTAVPVRVITNTDIPASEARFLFPSELGQTLETRQIAPMWFVGPGDLVVQMMGNISAGNPLQTLIVSYMQKKATTVRKPLAFTGVNS